MALHEKLMVVALYGAEWVMWLLVALSVAGLFVMFDRALFFGLSRSDGGIAQRQALSDLQQGDVSSARKRLEESTGMEAKIAAAALAGPLDGAEARVRSEATLVRIRMERHLSFLGTLGSNAPFVGLLGTVIGIIGAFAELDASGGQVSTGLMREIGEALVVTGLGLVVALPAVAGFNAFSRIIDERIDRGNALAQTLIAELSRLGESREA